MLCSLGVGGEEEEEDEEEGDLVDSVGRLAEDYADGKLIALSVCVACCVCVCPIVSVLCR